MEKQERDAILKRTFATPHGKRAAIATEVKRTPVSISFAKDHPPPPPLYVEAPSLDTAFPKETWAPTASFPKIASEWKEKKPFLGVRIEAFKSPPLEVAATPKQLPRSLAAPSQKPEHRTPSDVALLPSLTEPKIPTLHFAMTSQKPLLNPLAKEKSLSFRGPKSLSYSNDFEAELLFLEEENGRYVFAITLVPNADLRLPALKQCYYFLVDKANSIQIERLQGVKNAIHKAIDELDPQDTFNILAFDSKVEKAFSCPMTPSLESKAKANHFLNTLELGSFFSRTDLYKPLFLTLPVTPREDEIYTAILFTDGEGLNAAQTEMLQNWSRENGGRVSLYTINSNDDSHLDKLETLSILNKGKNITTPTKRGMKRKLLKLMKTIHAPIAKNLSCQVIAENSSIELLSSLEHTPHLFLNEPFTIVGSASSLDDFILFVQGRLNGKWMHIKKHFSFSSAKKGPSSLRNEWALQKELFHHDAAHYRGNF